MKVFISWSGSTSKAIAEALHGWIPNVIQAVEPWVSSENIEKGARWSTDMAKQLEETKVGVICLTPDNIEAPWILFEAGALSKTLEQTYVCPYLFGVKPSNLKGPLVQFQTTNADETDTQKLVLTINKALEEQALSNKQLEESFKTWWPRLKEKLDSLRPQKPNRLNEMKERYWKKFWRGFEVCCVTRASLKTNFLTSGNLMTVTFPQEQIFRTKAEH